jgi:uncharacterized protein (TIGR00369 family)
VTDEPGIREHSIDATVVLGEDPELLKLMREHMPDSPIQRLLGLRFVSLGSDEVIVEMPVREEAFNSTGNLHGGAIATLIDVAAGTAAALGSRFRPGVESIVTADLHVRYLGRPKTDMVLAKARVLRAGRQLTVVECQVADDSGNMVAIADFSSMLVPVREPLRPNEQAEKSHPDL